MKLNTFTKVAVIAASGVIIGTPVIGYLNQVPAVSPGRWAGTRFTCITGQAVIYRKSMSYWKNLRYMCLK